SVSSIYDLVREAIGGSGNLSGTASAHVTEEFLDYDAVYSRRSEWRLHLPFDHPTEPARCMVSGTGLTHLRSAQGREAMPVAARAGAIAAATSVNTDMAVEQMTDSMKMFRWVL